MQVHYLVICRYMACFADINLLRGSVATYARLQGAVGFLISV